MQAITWFSQSSRIITFEWLSQRYFQCTKACTSLYKFKLGPLMHITRSSTKEPLSDLDMGDFGAVSGSGQ